MSKFNTQAFDLFSLEDVKYGANIGTIFSVENTEFSKFEHYSFCCPEFTSGFGFGFNGSLLMRKPINDDVMLNLRIGYKSLNSSFTEIENMYLGLDDYPVYGNVEYIIESSQHNMYLQMLAEYPIVQKLNLLAGLKLNILMANSYSQTEDLSDGVFLDTKLPYRNRFDGELIEFSSLTSYLSFGINYDWSNIIDSSVLISPELSFDIPIYSKHNEVSWMSFPVNIGINFTYTPKFTKELNIEERDVYDIDTVYIDDYNIQAELYTEGKTSTEIDSSMIDNENTLIITQHKFRTDTIFQPKVKEINLYAELSVVGVEDETEFEEINMEVKEVSYFNMTPLLNYVFFDYNSYEIPKRYKVLTDEEINSFSMENLYALSTLDLYQHLLNIIAFRLRMNPDSKITLTGCNTDQKKEKFNMKLSKNRALAVKSYFVNLWGISEERINISSRNLPKNPSFRDTPEGKHENQRVEITSDDFNIIAPIIVDDTLRTTSPSKIRFYTKAESDFDISKYKIIAIQNGSTLKTFNLDSVPEFVDWNIDYEKNSIPRFETPIKYHCIIKDIENNEFTSIIDSIELTKIKIEKSLNVVGENKVEKFSLILFDFDNTSLSQYNTKIKDYIFSRLEDSSKVTISGYSDMLGDDQYNLRLSKERAVQLAKSLKIDEKNAKGFGESVLLYDNTLPEGRFYCRTVLVVVETPISKSQNEGNNNEN